MDSAIWRILDANANRAREALRVMEEHARFALDDASLAGEAKGLRHALAPALAPLDRSGAMVMRDTPGDVGTQLAGAGEYQRGASDDVVRAAGKRLTEALRVLEEYGKLIDREVAVALERLRYRAYELEKRLVHTVAARERFGEVRLYVLISEALCVLPWREVIAAAAEGGATCFQLREKSLTDAALLDRAGAFCEVCRGCGALSIINDRADITVAVGADGVHVGADDISVAAARRVVGPQRIVGVSTHTVPQAEAAATQCPDYIAVGPMFATALKPEYEIAGPATLRTVRACVSLPLVAIGGINAENSASIIEAGADCVAVCSAIISAPAPAAAALEIRRQLANSR